MKGAKQSPKNIEFLIQREQSKIDILWLHFGRHRCDNKVALNIRWCSVVWCVATSNTPMAFFTWHRLASSENSFLAFYSSEIVRAKRSWQLPHTHTHISFIATI